MFKCKMCFMLILLTVSFFQTSWAADTIIKIDGSSTVYPITEAVAEEFQAAMKGTVKVTVGISGSGGGFKKFSRGETDISEASRPIKQKEIEACRENNIEYIELPIAYDGIAVVVNLKNDWVKTLTIEDLRKMWAPESQGTVMKWSQIRPEWPDTPLKLFGPGADSGTFDYFTEAIVGTAKSSRGDFTASEDDNVLVQGISGDKSALGYFGLAYYEENKDKLKLVPIEGSQGPVLPSKKTVMDGSYNPLSRPLFLYVNATAAERQEIKDFIAFYIKHAPQLVPETGYIPLPESAYKMALERFNSRKTGTMFAGKETVGFKIEDLLKLEQEKK
ncbi:PstS family phosphate ABC transporter substrate-binding protein [bacterium]|nr:PstS family phosphate ABC transporter substrate-binding protein [bacterium]